MLFLHAQWCDGERKISLIIIVSISNNNNKNYAILMALNQQHLLILPSGLAFYFLAFPFFAVSSLCCYLIPYLYLFSPRHHPRQIPCLLYLLLLLLIFGILLFLLPSMVSNCSNPCCILVHAYHYMCVSLHPCLVIIPSP